jgi:hypothetical protein
MEGIIKPHNNRLARLRVDISLRATIASREAAMSTMKLPRLFRVVPWEM